MGVRLGDLHGAVVHPPDDYAFLQNWAIGVERMVLVLGSADDLSILDLLDWRMHGAGRGATAARAVDGCSYTGAAHQRGRRRIISPFTRPLGKRKRSPARLRFYCRF